MTDAVTAKGTPRFRPDPAWLFLFAGAALVASGVLIPALDDLRHTEWTRDCAAAAERYHQQRLANYSAYLDAVRAEERTLVISLAASHLNLAPADRQPMIDISQSALSDADMLEGLEPAFDVVPSPVPPRSLLQRWATSTAMRPWLFAAGGLCLLIGLMPMADARHQ